MCILSLTAILSQAKDHHIGASGADPGPGSGNRPIGGGGLITGISFTMKQLKPSVKLVGVMPEGSAVYYASRQAGNLLTLEHCASMADACVRKTGEPYLYPYIEQYVDEIVTVRRNPFEKPSKWPVCMAS